MEVFSCPQATSSSWIGPLAQHIHRFEPLGLSPPHFIHTHTHTHTPIYIYIYIYITHELSNFIVPIDLLSKKY